MNALGHSGRKNNLKTGCYNFKLKQKETKKQERGFRKRLPPVTLIN